MEALDENENWGISRLCIFPGSYRFLVRLRTITREIIGAVNRHSFAIGRETARIVAGEPTPRLHDGETGIDGSRSKDPGNAIESLE